MIEARLHNRPVRQPEDVSLSKVMRANGEAQTIPKSVENSLYNSVTSCMSIYVSELFK